MDFKINIESASVGYVRGEVAWWGGTPWKRWARTARFTYSEGAIETAALLPYELQLGLRERCQRALEAL
jgi:hypothetical protein